LIISINQENKIKISILNDQNQEKIIKLNKHDPDYIPLSISFNMNEIIIGNEEIENSINFFTDLIHQPEEYKEYKITYQNKEYSVISEVLFALVIDQFKKRIEKEFIIDKTKLIIETENKLLINRIKVSLDAIELPLDEFEFPEYDYQKQGEYLQEIKK
jgi:hypothetical protein